MLGHTQSHEHGFTSVQCPQVCKLLSDYHTEKTQIYKLNIEDKIIPLSLRPPISKPTCWVPSSSMRLLGLANHFCLKWLQQSAVSKSKNTTRLNKNSENGVKFPGRIMGEEGKKILTMTDFWAFYFRAKVRQRMEQNGKTSTVQLQVQVHCTFAQWVFLAQK